MYKWLIPLFYLFGTSHGQGSVNLTVMYRPECPRCKNFIINQMYQTWHQFSGNIRLQMFLYMPEFYSPEPETDKLNVSWVPKGDPRLLHMCASYEACGDQGTMECDVPNLAKYINYTYCDVQGNPLDESDHCATEAGLDPEFTKCHDSELALRLISYHATMTNYIRNDFRNEFTKLPFLLFNDEYKEEEYSGALLNLTAVICKYIPDQC